MYLDRKGNIYHEKHNGHNCWKIYSFPPTDFASGLCQELGIFQYTWCIYFPLLLSWSITRNNIYYVTRILYRLSCLVSSCTSFSPLVVNDILFKIVVEFFRIPVIPPLTILTNILGINIINSKDWSINFDTPILGLKLPFQLEIILPRMVAITNIKIDGIIYFIHPWFIDIKLNTKWI